MLAAESAREQLLALVMASHNRCGASSPARHFVSLPPLATAPLWDWCLGPDSESVLGLLVLTHGNRSASYYTFGVSSTLMSVTRDVKLRGSWCLWFTQPRPVAVDANRLVVTQMAGRSQSFSLLDVATEKRTWLLSESNSPADIVHAANHRWWLHYDHRSRKLVVVNLSGDLGDLHLHQNQAVLHSDCCAAKIKIHNCHQILREYEAVLMLLVETSQFLLVIDVNKTFATKHVSVLSMTKCLFSVDINNLRSSSLVMNKSSGDRVFICQVQMIPAFGCDSVVEVTEGVGACRFISGHVLCLSQLSTFLFCILKGGSMKNFATVVEIWDCSNASSAPLRVLQGFQGSDTPLVISQSGLIFHRKTSKQAFDVTDSSGFLLGTITLPIEIDSCTVVAS
ncbi:hypothetical protein Pelo_3492 [Pelomyxa schiedti]|nr:hypothetical protein Pelo_3492 [Pelomyxa schiedti]